MDAIQCLGVGFLVLVTLGAYMWFISDGPVWDVRRKWWLMPGPRISPRSEDFERELRWKGLDKQPGTRPKGQKEKRDPWE